MAEIKIPERFTVRRSEWLRGVEIDESGHNPSLLLNSDNKRCCVGFLAQSMGFADSVMVGIGDMQDLLANHRHIQPTSGARALSLALESDKVYQTNDSPRFTDPEREALLTAKFAALGIAVEFVD